ncbi:MAG: hypothetical protein EOP58_07390 [Sphingomonadales bacterium]|nr:MAG: hypothetical protein EOP58_07390 [Sphingomonadales bacterium]
MIRQLMALALTGASLGACDWGKPDPPLPPRQEYPRPAIDRPFDWLPAEPVCQGNLRRSEWLVCDNKNLRYLHRTLAEQWEQRRIGAGRRELNLIRRQQIAMISERALCEDVACVSMAYKRYLAGYSGPPEPRPTWTPRPAKPAKSTPRKPARPRWQDANWQNRDWRPGRRRGEQSCAAEVGGSASAYLVRQCRVANGRWDRSCTADRTCGDLREQIGDGCDESDRRPGFCSRR